LSANLRILAGFALACAMCAQSLDYSPASPTDAQIDEYLARKSSPMAGMGSVFAGSGRDYDIDPRLVVAIAGAETTFGKHQCADNNAWNWFHHRTCPQSPFAGYKEGAERVTKFMRLSYLNRGYDSVELIQHKYCASGCGNWSGLVATFLNEMPANAPSPVPPVKTTDMARVEPDRATRKAEPGAGVTETKPANEIDGVTAQLGKRVFGVPVYIVLLLGVLAIGAWAARGLPK